MDFSFSFFGKTLNDLTYEDIENYFLVEHLESNNIEFKSFSEGNFEAGINGVIKAIAGLLNSEGGIVIWGSSKGEKIDGVKKFIGKLSPVNIYKEKDWIINKVSDGITPLPIGIKVTVLVKSDNEYVYVFEVQQSQSKPHQYDGRYWVRLDGQTKPAPHYLIDALFKQISYPNIEVHMKVVNIQKAAHADLFVLIVRTAIFNFSPLQNEEDLKFRLLVHPGKFAVGDGHQSEIHGKIDLVHYGTPITNTYEIWFNTKSLEISDGKIRVMISYGGKKSPAKSCDNEIDVSKINVNSPKLEEVICSRSENKLFVDSIAEKGTDRNSTLDMFYDPSFGKAKKR